MKSIKDIIAARSKAGLEALGTGRSRPCSDAKLKSAIEATLDDDTAELDALERETLTTHLAMLASCAREPHDELLQVRVSATERATIAARAKEAGKTVSGWVRDRLL